MDKHTEECTNCSWDKIFPEGGISHFETEQEKHDRIAALAQFTPEVIDLLFERHLESTINEPVKRPKWLRGVHFKVQAR